MDIAIPDSLDITFEGFGQEAFDVLERIRVEPHIDTYRKEKESVQKHVKEPFEQFRDDLVVNWVIPNRLVFETERNVFSRLLKNDFGAGGCHHHLWMAFYRPGRTRLTDYQLLHSLSSEGFVTGLNVGENARDLLKAARHRMTTESEHFVHILNALLTHEICLEFETRRHQKRVVIREPVVSLPAGILNARGIWLRDSLSREEVLQLRGELVVHALETLKKLWPLYVFFATSTS